MRSKKTIEQAFLDVCAMASGAMAKRRAVDYPLDDQDDADFLEWLAHLAGLAGALAWVLGDDQPRLQSEPLTRKARVRINPARRQAKRRAADIQAMNIDGTLTARGE